MNKLIILTILSLMLTGRKKAGLPSFKGIIQTEHQIKGRVRFRIDSLKNNSAASCLIIKELNKITGISRAETSAITGSLTVFYDESRIEPFLLFSAVVKILDLESEFLSPKQSRISREIKLLRDSLDIGIYEKSRGILDLKSSVMLLLAGSIMYLAITKKNTMSAQATLLWWLFDSASK